MKQADPRLKEAILTYLRKVHPDISRQWFDEIEPVEIEPGILHLLVAEDIQLRFLQRCCTEPFREAAQAVTGQLIAVEFIGSGAGTGEESAANGMGPGDAAHSGSKTSNGSDAAGAVLSSSSDRTRAGLPGQRPLASRRATSPNRTEAPADNEMVLSPDYTFRNFIVGPNNELALAAAIAVSEKPGRAYNPLFLHGGYGLGKTHLLQAICQTALRRDPDCRIYYISCNEFMTQFHASVKDGEMPDFRHRYRNVDILVIDDIHDLARHERTQEEFFHTFNTLYQSGRQIVLSSDAPPREIPDLEERLVSRFNSGLVARINSPCFETRVEILKSKGELRGFAIPHDVASYIATQRTSGIRELEGVITQVQNLCHVSGEPISLELAQRAFDQPDADTNRAPNVQQILEAVGGYFEVKLSDLLSKKRPKSIVLPRQVGMWLARKHTRFSLGEIGGYFGGRDHTTVMHAVRKIEDQIQADARLQNDVQAIETELDAILPSTEAG